MNSQQQTLTQTYKKLEQATQKSSVLESDLVELQSRHSLAEQKLDQVTTQK